MTRHSSSRQAEVLFESPDVAVAVAYERAGREGGQLSRDWRLTSEDERGGEALEGLGSRCGAMRPREGTGDSILVSI